MGWLDGETKRNYISACRIFYQLALASKSTLAINGLPADNLNAFQSLLNRANAQIELIFGPPAKSIQSNSAANILFDIITTATNITSLDLCEWRNLDRILSFKQITRMTSLQKLWMRDFARMNDVIWTKNLQKLTSLHLYNMEMVEDWPTLTKLQDLTIKCCTSDVVETFLTNISTLTRLHIGFFFSEDTRFNFVLTTLSNLKDLAINGQITASCTTLESLSIRATINNFDINWLSSNTRLTRLSIVSGIFQVGDPRITALEKLRNITKATFGDGFNPTHIFRHLNLTDLTMPVPNRQILMNIVQQYTSLRALRIEDTEVAVGSLDVLTSLLHLTKFVCHEYLDPSHFPTTLKTLETCTKAKNLSELTRLENLHSGQNQVDLFSVAEHLTRLTRLMFFKDIDFTTDKQAVEEISKLSILSNLRTLEIKVAWPRDNSDPYHGFNMEFLTALAKLEKLHYNAVDFNKDLLNNLHSTLTRLTELRIQQREPDGEILARFKKLRRLMLYSDGPSSTLSAYEEARLSAKVTYM